MMVLTFFITIWLVTYFRKIPSSLTLDELCYFSNRVKKSKFTPIADYYVFLQSLFICTYTWKLTNEGCDYRFRARWRSSR